MEKRGRPRHPDILTPREWEVLALLRERLTNEQIAQRLDITERTARFHVSEILRKLDVSGREEAAQWSPEERRPWWALALAPLTLVWRKASASWVAGAAAVGAFVLIAAGISVLVWGMVRTGGEPAAVASGPPATAGDIIECMHGTSTTENNVSLNQLDPSAPATTVTLDGTLLDEEASTQILALLPGAEPAIFGVRPARATIGQDGRTSGHPLVIGFAASALEMRYVPAGNVAPYGLLFDPIASNAWGLVDTPDGTGYTQRVCTVPEQLEQLFADLGVPGYPTTGIL